MSDTPRACDRCYSLKTQCDGSEPCRRCSRLHIPCLRDRPFRRRGRPRKLFESTGRRSPGPPPAEDAGFQDGGGAASRDSSEAAAAPPSGPSPGSHNLEWPADEATAPPTRHVLERDMDIDAASPASTQVADNISTRRDNGDRDAVHAHSTPGNNSETSSRPEQPCHDLLIPTPAPLARSSPAWPSTTHHLSPTFTTPILNKWTAQLLVDTVVSNIDSLGCFKILDHPLLKINLTVNGPVEIEAMGRHGSQELLLVILAIAIEMDPEYLPPALHSEWDMLIDVLRSESLKLVPPLALTSADLSLSQCTALTLASYTWCMKEDLVQAARRWNNLAKLIWNEMRLSDMTNMCLESTARIGRAIQIQATVLDLLHHSHVSWPVGAETRTNPALSPQPYASPTTEFGSCSNTSGGGHDYFSLFTPLLSLLQSVLNSVRDVESMKRIRDSLELYYLDFPPDLLEFSSAKSPYHIEAMIWFHGIFILTFVRQDLLDILVDETLPMHNDFYFVLEHATLLGEAFPTLLRLVPSLQQISPATVFLMNLSSTIIASAMWQFHCCIDADTSSTLIVDAPESLVVIMSHHQEALKALSSPRSRYDLEFIGATSDILSSLCTGLTSETYQTLQRSLYVIAHYCWQDNGNGISRLATGATDGIVQTRAMSANLSMLCRVQLPPVAEPEDAMMRRATIQALCSPEARICQGCFDLSIQF